MEFDYKIKEGFYLEVEYNIYEDSFCAPYGSTTACYNGGLEVEIENIYYAPTKKDIEYDNIPEWLIEDIKKQAIIHNKEYVESIMLDCLLD